MKSNNVIQKIRQFARKNSKQEDIHGFPHVIRVYHNCLKLAQNFDVKTEILKISALLHDIGRVKEEQKNKNHAELSAEMAINFFESSKINLSKDSVQEIIHCIRAHSFSNQIDPMTLEAKILSDADKLDALGPIGLYRTIGFTVQNGGGLKEVINHLENKILNLRDLLYLNYSKQIAKKRHKFILKFYEQLKENH